MSPLPNPKKLHLLTGNFSAIFFGKAFQNHVPIGQAGKTVNFHIVVKFAMEIYLLKYWIYIHADITR